ncbi:MAG: LuxR family transcriptional regulator [Nitrospirae bacterium]|nr:MAG: LuxR family transcriptional regulator [Nitrospirota bacterium]
MQEIKNVILEKIPVGVIFFDRRMTVVFRNKAAEKFLLRQQLPPEVMSVAGRIFEAMDNRQMAQLFPGEVLILKRLEGSGSNWTFKLEALDAPWQAVCVFIIEEAASAKLDLNGIRMQFRLTRRETDVLRRVINGLTNRDIACDLEIGEQTVKDHLSNIYQKMGIKNRFAIVRFLMESPELYLQ